jgi:2-oxoisovalerate dehydrogenase E1 component
MTRNQLVDPARVRARGVVRFAEIPVNAYQIDLGTEMALYGAEGLFRIFHDMLVIREFETMLQSVTTTGEWHGIEYDHPVSEYLSIGQEAAVVGQAVELGPDDLVFGSHRSHGEVIAKCLTAARALGESAVTDVMEEFHHGALLRHAETIRHTSHEERTENFVLFGLLAECFGRLDGFNAGLAGSAQAFFPPFGSMPNNPTVGGAAPLAVGAGLFKRINRQPGIVVANLGDAALTTGSVWEAITFAAMDQYRGLWPDSAAGNPPVLFNFFNNFYGMGSQTAGETTGFEILARAGAGVGPEAMHAERVDGFNPLAVANAMRRKRDLLTAGEGPILLDVITYRFAGHWPGDPATYRTPEEVELWQEVDPIGAYGDLLIANAITTPAAVETTKAGIQERLEQILRRAADDSLCGRADAAFVESVTFSRGRIESFDPGRKPELLQPLNDNVRVKALTTKARKARDELGQPHSKFRLYQLRDGLFEAIAHRFALDSTLAAWGQDGRDWGGAFAVYRGLTELLPGHRLFNAPVAEAAVVGAGVGYALAGGRALVEVMYGDLVGRAGDEVLNQAGAWQARSGGLLTVPLVIRATAGTQWLGQHAEDWTAVAAHSPGLKVYYPASPADAKGMLNLALAGTDPVLFLEAQSLYDRGEEFDKAGVAIGYYETPEGEPVVRRAGTDLTIVTLGPVLYRALEVADTLQDKHNVSAEVVDLRFVNPLNPDVLIASVRKTGRVLFVSDELERGSFLHSVAGLVQEAAFDVLDSPPVVVGARETVVVTPDIDPWHFPQVETILEAIDQRILPLSQGS